MSRWLHSPAHLFNGKGVYMVTSGTIHKSHLFVTPEELDLLQRSLLELTRHYEWKLHAWSIFSNHYHFIATSPDDPATLKKLITHFHASSARKLNERHHQTGRKVWFQYWDSKITYHESYLARLNYVTNNPVKHKLVDEAYEYKWCSAKWFKETAPEVFYRTVEQVKTDKIKIYDDF